MDKKYTDINSTDHFPTWDEWIKEYQEKRRIMLIRLYDNGKGLSMQKIGDIYGLSKQRVQQIIRSQPTRRAEMEKVTA